MALTPSSMLPLGTLAPDFKLPDVVSGQLVNFSKLGPSKAYVVAFICNHCPYVKHILPQWVNFVKSFQKHGIAFMAINSNDVKSYPEDSPDKMRELALKEQFSFPYLFDENQSVAKAFQAACTPDFYIFDSNFKCVYRGQFDESRPSSAIPVTGASMSVALESILEGKAVDSNQKPSVGCNIKWKKS